jgi:hypothetical protein
MNIRIFFACLGASLLLAAAPQSPRLEPSSNWVLEYADDSCRLQRTFGEGDNRVVLLFESSAPRQMSMVAVGWPLRTDLSEIPVRFLPLQQLLLYTRPAKSAADGREPALVAPGVPFLPDDLREKLSTQARASRGARPPPVDLDDRAVRIAARSEFASSATGIEISPHRNRPVVLATGSLGEPIRMLDECARESLRDWGIDPDLEDRIARGLWAPDASRWLGPNDYPQRMVSEEKESEVKARLLVDASGRVSGCTGLSHFKDPEFNKVVCEKLRVRARFLPAELADGTKVPSYYVLRISFVLM